MIKRVLSTNPELHGITAVINELVEFHNENHSTCISDKDRRIYELEIELKKYIQMTIGLQSEIQGKNDCICELEGVIRDKEQNSFLVELTGDSLRRASDGDWSPVRGEVQCYIDSVIRPAKRCPLPKCTLKPESLTQQVDILKE
jgi:hypothetical protein